MKQEKILSKKLFKYQINFKKIKPIQLEFFNIFLIENNIGSLEETDSNYYFYLSAQNYEKELNKIKKFLQQNKIDYKIKFIKFLDESYLYEWEKYFTPEIIDNFIIKPPFYNLEIIEVETGQAFGTGKHPTTKICIEFIIDITKRDKVTSFLDAGTGSGILSIIASKKDIKKIFAFDIDYDSICIAKKNFEKNNCKGINLFCSSFEAINKKKFDLVSVNILSSIILKYKKTIKKLVRKKGFLIISGIEISEKKDFILKLNYQNYFKLLKEKVKDNWCGFLFQKL